MSKFKSSWILMKQSCKVLFTNKKLLFFPAMSGFLSVFILMFFLSGILLQLTGHAYTSADHWKVVADRVFLVEEGDATQSKKPGDSVVRLATSEGDQGVMNSKEQPTLKPILFLYTSMLYVISMILITFFNTAFFNEIIHALNGQPVSIVGGLKFAFTRIKPILYWALLASSVGLILRKIEEQFGFIGRFVIGLIGIAWSVASVFAIPVIIRSEDNHNPLKVLKASGLLIKEKWGEGLVGYAGINFIGAGFLFLFTLLYVGLVASVMVFVSFDSEAFILIGAAAVLIWMLMLMAFSYVQSIVNSIFRCALYLYASEGVLPESFDIGEESLEKIWRIKKK